MSLRFVLITGLLLQLVDLGSSEDEGDAGADDGAEPEAPEDVDSRLDLQGKINVFHFDGSNDGYTEMKDLDPYGEDSIVGDGEGDAEASPAEDEAASEDDEGRSDFSLIEVWGLPWTMTPSQTVSLGAWFKPEKNSTGLNKIMQFKYVHHYELSMKGDRLELNAFGQSNTSITATFPSLKIRMDEWLYVLITVPPRSQRLPSVYIKGLNKDPLQLLHPKISEKEYPGMESTGSKNLTLGKGFSGRITPVLIGRHSSPSNFDRYKNCLTDHDQSDCNEYLYSRVSGSDLISNYMLSPNSNIILEPYTDISSTFQTYFQCKDFEISLTIDPKVFNIPRPTTKSVRYYDTSYYYGRWRTRYYKEYPVNVTLGDLESGCNLTWVRTYSEGSSYPMINTNLTSCGFQTQEDGEEIIYKNSVYSHASNGTKKLMDVSCRYTPRPVKKEEVRVGAYVMDQVVLETTHTYDPLSFSLHLFSDSSFSKALNMPVQLRNTDEDIYVEARVDGSGQEAVLLIESCRTHITLNKLDNMKKVLIRNFEAVSPSVEFLDTKTEARKRFKFKADRFEEYPDAMVYLSCVMSSKKDPIATERA